MAKRRRSSRRSGGNSKFSLKGIPSLLMPAATGAIGALAVNGITNYAIPEQFRAQLLTGNTAFLTRAGIALALGAFGPKIPVVGPYARDMAKGALIVILADLGKQLAMTQGFNVAGLGYIGPARVVNLPRGVRAPSMAGVGGGVGNVGRMGMYVAGGRR